ncbi:hypothetical protein MCAP1_001019 [Malassezia caprae]|uniref:VASt domain-containing protein n=1 Tax=Malassezia caprae TaxID=1381934 RepID=A0AAF0E4T7_9BASI|nr:hypothetical protein MCAP1_001019 [Malassezia caprae]
MPPFHRLKRSDTVNSKNGTPNGKTRLNRHDVANLTFGYSNLNPMSRINSKAADFFSHFPNRSASQSSHDLSLQDHDTEETQDQSQLIRSASLSQHIERSLSSYADDDSKHHASDSTHPSENGILPQEHKEHASQDVSPVAQVPRNEDSSKPPDPPADGITTTPLGLPNVPLHVTIPSSVQASTEGMEPFSPVSPNTEHRRKSNAATAAYRDLVTGAVVETDQEGNQAEPTAHPSISSPSQQLAPGGLPVMSLSNIEMPGLAAAANFLPQEREQDGEASEQRRPMGILGDANADGGAWPQNVGTQITGFAVASSKRNVDFHALFPSIPEDDYLIESYSCAMSRDLLIQGRLYVSEAHLAFHSNILGWVTSIVVSFSDVVSIEKRNTAYLIPNAIIVKTLENRYTFSSLVSRDLTYGMLVNIWRLSAPSAAAQQLADTEATDESDGEAHASDPDQSKEGMEDASMPDKSVDEGSSSVQGSRPKLTKREKLRHKLHAARLNAKKKGQQEAEADADNELDDSDEEVDHDDGQEHPVTSCDWESKGEHLKEVVMDDTFDATPHQLFDLMFVSDFLERFFKENQQLQEVNVGEWNSEDKTKDEAEAARKVTYVKALNGPIGPKQTRCVITDEQLHIDFDKFCTTLTTTRTPDVPSGNSFSVQTRMCFTWAENRRVRLYVTCSVEWTGRSMIKSIVDKASIEGQREYFRDLGQMMREHISDHPEVYGSPKSQQSKKTKEQADKNAMDDYVGSTPKDSSSGGCQPLDAFAQSLDMRPSGLILAVLIVVLLILNIWVSWRGSPVLVRDPTNPHRLLTRSAYSSRPLNVEHVNLMLEEEVQSVLDALAASRRMTESLEEDIRKLQNVIQKQTNEQAPLL